MTWDRWVFGSRTEVEMTTRRLMTLLQNAGEYSKFSKLHGVSSFTLTIECSRINEFRLDLKTQI